MDWQDISTAPKTGEIVWAFLFDTGIKAVSWDSGISKWVEAADSDEEWSPRWWMPYAAIPEPGSDPTPAAAEARATKATEWPKPIEYYAGLIEDLQAGVRPTGDVEEGVELFNVEGASDLMGQAADVILALSQPLPSQEAKDGAAPSPETGWRLVAWLHEVREPDKDWSYMLSKDAEHPWSHWIARHKDQCEFRSTPLYAAPAAPSPDLAALEELAGRLEQASMLPYRDRTQAIYDSNWGRYATALHSAILHLKALA